MSRPRRVARRVIAGLLVGSSLAACSTAADDVGSPPPAPSGATSGGVLEVGITAPGGVDPLNAYEPAGKLVSSTMCDTLTAVDPVTGQLREAVAKGWVLSDDGSLTVKARRGVRFSDGTELTAKDVNYSLQQLVSTVNASYARGYAEPFLRSFGEDEATELLADPESQAVDVATSINRHDFQLQRRTRNGGALRAFAEPAMAPVSRAAYDADPIAFAGSPVCVGPYVLEQPYVPGATRIALKRSDHYYGENVGYTSGGTGYPDRIVFRVYASPTAALAGYDRGEVDVVQVPTTAVAAVEDRGSLVLGPATAVEFLGLPTTAEGPLRDPDVRAALSLAVDRTALVARVFGPATEPATGFLPTALAITEGRSLADRTVKAAPLTACGDTLPPRPDLDAARQRLAAAAARPDAAPLTALTLEVNDDEPYPELAAELARQWSALGIDVKVVTTPWSAYVAKATQGTGLPSAFRIRWATSATAPATTFNDVQSFLEPLLSSRATTVGNWAQWRNQDFDFGLADDAAPVTDVQRRGIAFGRLAEIACEQLPLLPLVAERPAYLVRASTVGSARDVPVGRDGQVLLRELYLR